ncbi:MAG: cysteine desulfurase family protein [Lachnospiraceae bacterium]|nr:cysteine desulfurase family protein [Lachnospiraceae bacterium]
MKEIYLDNSATTRCYEEVADIVRKTMLVDYGNPSSMHRKGVEAERYLRTAQEQIADTMRVKPSEIFFTSGGTESNNWALFGTAQVKKRAGKRIITSEIEHSAIGEPMKKLADLGFDVVKIPVDAEGRIRMDALREALTKDTILVSVMMVNNEIGTVEPVAEIGQLVRKTCPYAYFHVDAIQSYGKCRIYPKRMNIDMLSVSGHKIHGPKGVGFLYVDSRCRIDPIIYGGGQQNGMRSGTDNVPGAAGLGLAAEMIYKNLDDHVEQMYRLKEKLAAGLKELPDVRIYGPANLREGAPGILNASFIGVRSEVLLHTLEDRGIYVSAGSACSSHHRSGSATMTAIHASKAEMESSLRFSFSEETTEEEIDTTLAVLREVLPQLRKFVRM